MMSDLAFLAGLGLGIACVAAPFCNSKMVEIRTGARSRRHKDIVDREEEL